MDVSGGNLNMAMAPYRYTSKRIAKLWRSKNVITSNGFESTGVLFRYTCLSLVMTIISVTHFFFEYILFIKKRWGGPTFKLWKGSWGPTFKFWRGSWVPTFKLWRGCRVPGPGVLVPILHHAFLERVLRVDVKLRLLKLINGGGGY